MRNSLMIWFALAFIALGLSVGPAAAQEIAGQYTASNGTEVTTFDLAVQGTTLTGTMTGSDTGAVRGEIQGNRIVNGIFDFGAVGVIRFEGVRSATGLTLTLIDNGVQLELTPVGGGPVVPAGGQYYYVDPAGQTQGPVGLERMRQLVGDGTIRPATNVFRQGDEQWVAANTLPELGPDATPVAPPPPGLSYYVVDNGASVGPMALDALIARIRAGGTGGTDLVWKDGGTEWVAAESLPELAPAFLPPGPETPDPPPGPETPDPELPAVLKDTTITLPKFGGPFVGDELARVQIVLGATLGVLFHEIGHALIGELRMPATGPEEDVADEFSALLLAAAVSEQDGTESEKEFMRQVAAYSVLMWKALDDTMQRNNLELPWYDEHSDNDTRFRNTLCLLFGADQQGYKDLADKVGLPEPSRARCLQDFPKRYDAWERIAEEYVRDLGDGEGRPRNQPIDTPGGKVSVIFDTPATETGIALMPIFRDSQIFEGLAASFSQSFVWPRDLTLRFADCGVVNAWYDPNIGRITMCWEVVEAFGGTLLDAEGIARH